MVSKHLLNLLLKYRKRSALSQEEVAYLLGSQSGAKICRYERFLREPGLQTALAFEVIFDRPVSELFSGLFEQAQREVKERARELEKKESRGGSPRLRARKRQTLAKISSSEPRQQFK